MKSKLTNYHREYLRIMKMYSDFHLYYSSNSPKHGRNLRITLVIIFICLILFFVYSMLYIKSCEIFSGIVVTYFVTIWFIVSQKKKASNILKGDYANITEKKKDDILRKVLEMNFDIDEVRKTSSDFIELSKRHHVDYVPWSACIGIISIVTTIIVYFGKDLQDKDLFEFFKLSISLILIFLCIWNVLRLLFNVLINSTARNYKELSTIFMTIRPEHLTTKSNPKESKLKKIMSILFNS